MQRHTQDRSATAVRSSTRWSFDDARRILDEWATSGESLHAFAQGRGLVPQRLWWWRKRLAGERRPRVADRGTIATAPAFLPVTVTAVEAEPVLATLETGVGLRVELRVLDGTSAAWVAALVKALGAAS